MVGVCTLLTVTPLPVRSALPAVAGFQSAAAAILKVVPPTDEVPFLFSKPSTLTWSVAFSATVKDVAEVISTFDEVRA